MTGFYVLWWTPSGRKAWDGPYGSHETAESQAQAREIGTPVIVHESDPELCGPLEDEDGD